MTRIDRRRMLLGGGATIAATIASAATLAAVTANPGVQPGVPQSPPVPVGSAPASALGLSVLRFGADPSGETDSSAAFQKAVDACGDGILQVPRGKYRFKQPLAITRPGLVMVGESCRGERTAGSVLFKSKGFEGDALIRIGGVKPTVSGVSISGIAIDGRGQPGAGIYVERAGNVVLSSIVVHENLGWGIWIDGGWLCSLHNIAANHNGTPGKAAVGGGIMFSSNTRESANCRLFDSYCNKNLGSQLKLAGSKWPKRVASLTVWGGQFERGAHEDPLVPVIDVEAADRTTFFGCNAIQPKGKPAPCVAFGSGGGMVRDVSFISCYFQYTGKQSALTAKGHIESIDFIDCRFGGKAKLFDFDEAIPKGSIFFSRPVDLSRGKGRAAIAQPAMTLG